MSRTTNGARQQGLPWPHIAIPLVKPRKGGEGQCTLFVSYLRFFAFNGKRRADSIMVADGSEDGVELRDLHLPEVDDRDC
eukprot:480161-Rhodomonas_salina.3